MTTAIERLITLLEQVPEGIRAENRMLFINHDETDRLELWWQNSKGPLDRVSEENIRTCLIVDIMEAARTALEEIREANRVMKTLDEWEKNGSVAAMRVANAEKCITTQEESDAVEKMA